MNKKINTLFFTKIDCIKRGYHPINIDSRKIFRMITNNFSEEKYYCRQFKLLCINFEHKQFLPDASGSII